MVAGDMNSWAHADTTKKLAYNSETQEYVLEGLELAANQGFKIKVCEDGWGRGSFGAEAIGTVTLAEGVTYDGDARSLFSATSNISASKAMTVTLTVKDGKLNILITAITADTAE